MNLSGTSAVLIAAALALFLRVSDLGIRPLHNDEAVNAFKLQQLWDEGDYTYDPDEYHGPLLHYATIPVLWSLGSPESNRWTNSDLRMATACFGVGLVLLCIFFQPALKTQSTAWAALFLAVSPAMVFYSRYFIHEMLLVFFTGFTLISLWNYHQTGKAAWAARSGAGIGLMWATKETFVLTLASMAAAALAAHWWMRKSMEQSKKPVFKPQHWMIAMGSLILVWVVFFSSFFTHPSGLPDSIRTYLPWLQRAGGDSPHIHAWHFYFERLIWFQRENGPVWSEAALCLLGIIGASHSLARRKSLFAVFLSFFTLFLTLIYCVISYKTPWCMLSFYYGWLLLAGIGASVLIDLFPRKQYKIAFFLFITGACAHLVAQSLEANHEYSADRRNPYVYSQTSPDILKLVDTIDGIASIAPEKWNTIIKIMAPEGDYWPLPWLLRHFKYTGWYDALPPDPYSPMILVSSEFDARLDDQSDRRWVMVGIHEQRPGKFFELYVDLEIWKRYVETLPKPSDD